MPYSIPMGFLSGTAQHPYVAVLVRSKHSGLSRAQEERVEVEDVAEVKGEEDEDEDEQGGHGSEGGGGGER